MCNVIFVTNHITESRLKASRTITPSAAWLAQGSSNALRILDSSRTFALLYKSQDVRSECEEAMRKVTLVYWIVNYRPGRKELEAREAR
jgi:hypothetical protein